MRLGDLHRPDRLAERVRIGRAPLDCGVTGRDHALDTLDHADAGHVARADRELRAVGGEWTQSRNAVSRSTSNSIRSRARSLPRSTVALDVALAAPGADLTQEIVDGDLLEHLLTLASEVLGGPVDVRR